MEILLPWIVVLPRPGSFSKKLPWNHLSFISFLAFLFLLPLPLLHFVKQELSFNFKDFLQKLLLHFLQHLPNSFLLFLLWFVFEFSQFFLIIPFLFLKNHYIYRLLLIVFNWKFLLIFYHHYHKKNICYFYTTHTPKR